VFLIQANPFGTPICNHFVTISSPFWKESPHTFKRMEQGVVMKLCPAFWWTSQTTDCGIIVVLSWVAGCSVGVAILAQSLVHAISRLK